MCHFMQYVTVSMFVHQQQAVKCSVVSRSYSQQADDKETMNVILSCFNSLYLHLLPVLSWMLINGEGSNWKNKSTLAMLLCSLSLDHPGGNRMHTQDS